MQVDLVTGMDFGLATERKVIALFAGRHMGQQARPRAPAGNRA